MLTKNKKYIILIVIDVIISAFIWYVNGVIFRNAFWICLILSTTTFLIIFTPFETYWNIRDIWFDRWTPLHIEDFDLSKVKIEVDGGHLYANLVILKNQNFVKSKNGLIVISPGFSDTKESLQHYYFPLAYQGYVILAYDARGIGKSIKTGERSDFIKRIEDFNKIIEWIKNNETLKYLKIYCVGVSIGAITVLCGGFPNKDIEKIVAISAISKYNENIRTSKRIVKLNYYLKGINLKLDEKENQKLSPFLMIKNIKKSFSKEDWKEYSKKVMLIHSRDDNIIQFENFEENISILELPIENQLILSSGGHTQKKNELAIVGAMLNFFNDYNF